MLFVSLLMVGRRHICVQGAQSLDKEIDFEEKKWNVGD